MITEALLATLTVASAPGVECPDREALVDRLREAGITIRDEDDVHVRFSFESGRRAAEIVMPGATPRRIEHGGPDCSALADAAVALLTVLLDERSSGDVPPPPPPAAPAPPREAHSVVRLEAGSLVSSGIVAPLAAGAASGAAWRPLSGGSIGIGAETWPARDHALREGAVSVSASTIAVVACAGPTWRALSVEGCLLGHVGLYALSADGFAVVRPAVRPLFGTEAALRASLAIAGGLGVFVRAGMWLPVTRLDVTVRGAASGFATTSLGPKGIVGLELNL